MKNTGKFIPNGTLTVHSEDAMRELGRRLAEYLEPGDVLGLVGDLGAGKTRLVQGILQGLHSPIPAVSPSFGLVLEHPAARIPTAHFDWYRLRSEEEVLSIGWEDFLAASPPMLLLVEWADRFHGALMPPGTIWITIARTPDSPNSRQVKLKH